MRILDAIEDAKRALTPAGFDDAGLEAEFLLGGVLRCSPTQLFFKRGDSLSEAELSAFRKLVEGRRQRVPAAYLLGEKNFMGLDFQLGPDVLIPRPETELLVEWAAHLLKKDGAAAPAVLEIGAGSGCICVTLSTLLPVVRIHSVDVSEAALQVAHVNARRHGVEGKIRFLASDLYGALGAEFHGHFDMIVSNPPYVSSSEMKSLEPELFHEPVMALDGGTDGLDVVRRLIANSSLFLKPKGFILLEIGASQGDAVTALLRQNKFSDIEIKKDFSGHDRMVVGRNHGSI